MNRNTIIAATVVGLLLVGAIITIVIINNKNTDEGFDPSKHRIYCAGPMDTTAELKQMHDIGVAVRQAGYKTYVPSDDGIALFQAFDLIDKNLTTDAAKSEAKYWLMVAVYASDINNLLKRCDGVLANYNPAASNKDDPDGGTVMETVTAFSFNYPLVLFKSSPSRLLPPGSNSTNGWDNPMLIALTNNFNIGTNDYAEHTVPNAIAKLNKIMKNPPTNRTPLSSMPTQTQNYIALGELMHAVENKHPPPRNDTQLWEVCKGLIATTKSNASKYGVKPWNGYIIPSQ